MEIFRTLDAIPANRKNGAVSIGNFDGVHIGHAQLIDRLRSWANRINGPAIVFTFDPHPVRILRPDETPPPLTWTERKAELLARLGVDALIAYPASVQLLAMSHVEFFEQIIVGKLETKALVEGPNFLFGKDRKGNRSELERLCREHDIGLQIVEPIMHSKDDTSTSGDTEMVSSSLIRAAIKEGQIDLASRMLTKPYRVRGMVTHGVGRGAKLGFPTANLEAVDTLIPGLGVYAGIAYVDGEPFVAAIHIGANPTFAEEQHKLEVHLLNFHRSLYGEALEVEFHKRIRDVLKFDSPDALRSQIDRDLDSIRAWADSRQTNPS